MCICSKKNKKNSKKIKIKIKTVSEFKENNILLKELNNLPNNFKKYTKCRKTSLNFKFS